jgi:predicted NBD/HSP70 family sugar kinase
LNGSKALSDLAVRTFVHLLLSPEQLSRKRLAPRLGISAATATQVVRELADAELLSETELPTPGRGANERLLTPKASSASIIGVSIAPSDKTSAQLTGVLVALDGSILHNEHRIVDSTDEAVVSAEVGSLVNELQAKRPASAGEVVALGVELGGVVSAGRVELSPAFGWRGFALADAIAKHTGLHTVVENDANALAVFEQLFGVGQSETSLAALIIDTGVGCGLILDGNLHRGATGMAGEVGHTPVTPELFEPPPKTGRETSIEDLLVLRREEELVCSCGRTTGCAEVFIERHRIGAYYNLVARRNRLAPDADVIRELLQRCDDGDELAAHVVRRAAWALALVIVSLLDTTDVPLISVCGNELVSSAIFQETVTSALRLVSFPTDPTVELRVRYRERLQEDGARGAAAAALYHLLHDDARVSEIISDLAR